MTYYGDQGNFGRGLPSPPFLSHAAPRADPAGKRVTFWN
jgi:hypothetical protein